jgi:hypothetical protein
VEVHALQARGWTVSAIARHLGRDRKTIRAYLNGERQPAVRKRTMPDPLARFEPDLRARLGDDQHGWATVLFAEIVALGYATFVRQLRQRGLRPHCEACRGVSGRETIEIDHPAGEEIQWDWFERRRAPWGGTAYVLLGTLATPAGSGGAGRVDRPGALDRGDRRGAAPAGWDRQDVADRPAGHGHRARDR